MDVSFSNKISSRLCMCLSLLISAPACASGFYAGLGAGPQSADLYQKSYITVQTPRSTTLTANVLNVTQLSGTGVFASLLGGYSWINQHYYLAGEINANLSSLLYQGSNTEFISGSTISTKYRIKNSFGLSVFPGYVYKDSIVFYLRFGYALGNFNSSSTEVTLANVSRYLSGFCYGLGMNYFVTEKIGARVEFDQTLYQNTQFNVTAPPAKKITRFTPTVNQALFSLIYNIA